MILRLGRAALLLGAVLIFASFMMDHPPMYPGGKVEYGSQAIAIAKVACRDMDKDAGISFFQWQAWLSDQTWYAGFSTHGGWCYVQIDPRSGKKLYFSEGAID